jgi:F0F1-type ATP synthase membrane subunit c/vacuolar-type H+-ATPase subunit K
MRKLFITLFVLSVLFSCLTMKAEAQQVSLGTAIFVQIEEQGIVDGDILTSQESGKYLRANLPYDPFLFGVVATSPAMVLYDKAEPNGVPVISLGRAYVRVSTEKGDIKPGDPITSSTTPGVGVKATDNGYVIGIAEEGFTSEDPQAVDRILVAVDARFAQINSNLFSTLFAFPRQGFSAPMFSPVNTLRYIIALLIAAASMYGGFRFFGFASIKGVEAIGRNPLAKKTIVFTVILNAFLTVTVMFFGFLIAYLVLVL